MKDLQEIIKGLEEKTLKPEEIEISFENCTIDYQEALNPAQLLAASRMEGDYLLIAGAGSGKTRTLTYRSKYLLEQGIPPEEILLLTFTRKAAGEMKARILKDVGAKKASGITVSTFHAFANAILMRYGPLISLPRNFTMLDKVDAEDALDYIKNGMGLKKKEKTLPPTKGQLYEIISLARNKHEKLERVLEASRNNRLQVFKEEVVEIAKAYFSYKKQHHMLDFEDLLDYVLMGLRTNPVFREKLIQKYRFIMVDEYQDTNLSQFALIKELWAGGKNNLMVVGDDHQSIYGFRGAHYDNILRFGEAFPHAHLIKLTTNYRSSAQIISLINGISDKLSLGYHKQLKDNHFTGPVPTVNRFAAETSEAAYVAGQIEAIAAMEGSYRNCAVLYRNTSHGNLVQTELAKRGIPFEVVGGIKFNEKAHVRDLLALVKVIHGPLDAISWGRVLKLLPGVGPRTSQQVISTIIAAEGDFKDLSFTGASKPVLEGLFKALQEGQEMKEDLLGLLTHLRSYYEENLFQKYENPEDRRPDLDIIETLGQLAASTEDFLSVFALDPPNLQKVGGPKDPDQDEEGYVTLSTVHSAKGLEWHHVFLIHMVKGMFPSELSMRNHEELEEERRLFYVACSRAATSLTISFPEAVFRSGQYFGEPSPFVSELPRKTYEEVRHFDQYNPSDSVFSIF